jgi:hypothetical protein
MRSNSNTYGYANGITDGNSNAERNGDVYSYPHTDTNGYFNSNLKPDSNANCNRYGYIYSYTNNHCDGHIHANANGHCHSNSDSNVYSDGYGHGYSYSYSHVYPNPNANGHTNSGTNTCFSDSPKRKPRDCQQLHRELDQCKRGDRLPVGCGYGLFFCPLCARLPKFGRRQHNESKRERTGHEYVLLLPVTRLQRQWHKPEFQRYRTKDEKALTFLLLPKARESEERADAPQTTARAPPR